MKRSSQLYIVYSVIVVVFLSMIAKCANGQDTTIKFNVPYRFVVQGTRTGSITIPLPKKDTIRIHDTVYINNCPPIPTKDSLVWSKFGGTFQSFIDSAIKNKLIAVVDKDVTPLSSVNVKGSITIQGSGNTIRNLHPYLFVLDTGVHVFKNFNVEQAWNGTAFFVLPISNSKWENRLEKVGINGGSFGYQASRGKGVKSILNDCNITVSRIAVQVYSQDGNENELIMRNVILKTDSSHHIYIHPNVSVSYYNVKTLGKTMSQNQFSSGNIGYYTAKYGEYRLCSNAEPSAMWNIVPLLNDNHTTIDSSQMTPYVIMGIKPMKVWATNSTFKNGGNGVFLRGTLYNCNGAAWPFNGDSLNVVGGVYDEINMVHGGYINALDTEIKYMVLADRGNGFGGRIVDSKFISLQDGRNGNGVLWLQNTEKPKGAYGSVYRPEIIKIVDVK